jgi:CubicO group peptidase (beta-lactamase class C family)
MKYSFVAALLVLFAATAFAEPPIPETPAGHALMDWMSAYNSGDRDQLEALKAKYHRDRPIDSLLDLRHQQGAFDILKVEHDAPESVVVLLGARDSDTILRFTVKVDPADPTARLDTRLEGIPRPAEFELPRLTAEAAGRALIARVDGLVAQDKFSGTVLIVGKKKTVLAKNWGLADREAGMPIKADMKFRLGSMDKMFTGIAALQLVAHGKLSLDGTVGQYWPDYPNQELASKVTIRQLLNNTSGVGDIFGPEFDQHRLELKTLADYVSLYGARAPEHEPGATDGYDNYGFILLGAIIGKVSGQDYYDYVQQHIFQPLHMNDTGFAPETDRVAGLAPGYTLQDGKWVSNADTLPWRGTPAGGGYSTLGDLVKFAKALGAGTLLPAKLQAAAITPQNHLRWYGYGFETQYDQAARYYGHSGGAPGMNADFRIFPDQGVVFICLSNMDGPYASTLADFYTLRMPLK